jgi:hypothetical protein
MANAQVALARRVFPPMLLVPALALGIACGADRDADPPPPPAESYTAATFQLTRDGQMTPVSGARISPAFFESTPARPLLGRAFAADDFAADAVPAAIISHAFWQEEFAGGPDVIGRSIELDGLIVVVVGVMPEGFDVPPGASVWMAATGAGS